MKQRFTVLLASLFLCLGGIFAHTTIKGTMLSQEDGQPIAGALVKIAGMKEGRLPSAGRVADGSRFLLLRLVISLASSLIILTFAAP